MTRPLLLAAVAINAIVVGAGLLMFHQDAVHTHDLVDKLQKDNWIPLVAALIGGLAAPLGPAFVGDNGSGKTDWSAILLAAVVMVLINVFGLVSLFANTGLVFAGNLTINGNQVDPKNLGPETLNVLLDGFKPLLAAAVASISSAGAAASLNSRRAQGDGGGSQGAGGGSQGDR